MSGRAIVSMLQACSRQHRMIGFLLGNSWFSLLFLSRLSFLILILNSTFLHLRMPLPVNIWRFQWVINCWPGHPDSPRPVTKSHSCCRSSLVWPRGKQFPAFPVMADNATGTDRSLPSEADRLLEAREHAGAGSHRSGSPQRSRCYRQR